MFGDAIGAVYGAILALELALESLSEPPNSYPVTIRGKTDVGNLARRCSAKTRSVKQCTNKAVANSEFCGTHAKLVKAEQFGFDVFLSYNSNDWKAVHALAKQLKRTGCGCGWTIG